MGPFTLQYHFVCYFRIYVVRDNLCTSLISVSISIVKLCHSGIDATKVSKEPLNKVKDLFLQSLLNSIATWYRCKPK